MKASENAAAVGLVKKKICINSKEKKMKQNIFFLVSESCKLGEQKMKYKGDKLSSRPFVCIGKGS